MSIQQIKIINSVGRFRSSSASGDVTFNKYTLIFGENGRGKTTLCAILRSLQTDSPAIIIGRKTLSSTHKPMVRIAMNSGTAAFTDGAWKAPETRIRIFDAQYIADNIYSGDAIGTDQRRNLCRVMLGQDGVVLAQKYDACDNGINVKNSEIRTVRAQLTQHVQPSEVSDFIELEEDPEIDAKIEAKEREVVGLKEAGKLKNRPGLDLIELPPLPTNLVSMLETTLEDVSRDAEKLVRQHLASHHVTDDASWILEGVQLIKGDDCPFCGQSTKGLDLIEAYRSLFTEEYQRFRNRITSYKANAERLLSDDRIELALSRVAGNENNAEGWAQYVSLKPPKLDEKANIKEIVTAFRDTLLDLCKRKIASPLDRITAPAVYHEAYERFEATKQLLDVYNEHVHRANAEIAAYKISVSANRTQAAERELAGLRLIKKRHEPAIAAACAEYKKLTEEKGELDRQKVAARDALNRYSTDILARYKKSINANLRKFNAGFHIDQVRIEYTGRIPNSSFCVVINDTPVDVGSIDTPADQPSFKNTLSAGDRSTLALAFFMTELAEDPNKSDTIVVFDDPFNSQDHYRRTCTITEIRRCGNNVAQVVVMSHDRHFLREMWDLPLPPADRKALELVAVGKRDTVIAPWDIENDTESDDAANRRILTNFHTKREGQPRDVVQKIRPVIETHIRRLAPKEMEGVSTLGAMLSKIRDDENVSAALKAAYDDLDDLNTYTRQFMHGDPHYSESKRLSAEELAGFAEKVLLVVGH